MAMVIIMSVLEMLGGVAVFMYGMKMMSSGLQQGAGAGLRNVFRKISGNKLFDYGIGIGATALVQSSSATSIMTVGLAHAEIVTVKQGSGFVLGAKVGTTLTAFIFALSGISKGGFSISSIFAAVAFVGVIIIYTTENDMLNKIAPFLIGFGMLFIGLGVMEAAIGGKDSLLCTELTKVFQFEIMQNPILLVLIGVIFAGIVLQSSTAATGVFIALLATGVIHTTVQAFFLVMGANIGTCSDGIMASLSTNAYGKRIAAFHVLTSTIGAVAFSIILVIFGTPIMNLFESIFPGTPAFSLATFNLAYNVIYTSVLLVFLEPLIEFTARWIKDKHQKQKELNFIEERFLANPVVAIEQSTKEVAGMAVLAKKNLDLAFESLLECDVSQKKQIKEGEDRVDFLHKTLSEYLTKISSKTRSHYDERLIGSLHHVVDDIERLSDYAVSLVKETNDLKENDAQLPEPTKEALKKLYAKISEMFALGNDAFLGRDPKNLREIAEIQLALKALISEAKDEHGAQFGANAYSQAVSKAIYQALFALERVTDHIVNYAFSIRSITGSKADAFEAIEREAGKKFLN